MSDLEPIPFFDLVQQYKQLQQEWIEAIHEVGGTGQFIQGPNVAAFEKEFAGYCGRYHAIGVGNGTDALVLSLRALGIGEGDEVITTPFTFFASAEAITVTGATPVFVDINSRSFNLDVSQVESKITGKTKAVLPVHLFGCPVEMDELSKVCADHQLSIIEDCAQAFGARWQGQLVGSWGNIGAFSFYPTKILGCYGDGGMVVTDNLDLAESIRHLTNHGASGSFLHDTVGTNSRLDEIQASLLRIKLRQVDAAINRRQELANTYDTLLSDFDITLPGRPALGSHVFNLYTIQVPDRERLVQAFNEQNIGYSVCYPQPLHLQKVYKNLGYQRGDFPVCEKLSELTISLPLYPEMSEQQMEQVCDVIKYVISPHQKHYAAT